MPWGKDRELPGLLCVDSGRSIGAAALPCALRMSRCFALSAAPRYKLPRMAMAERKHVSSLSEPSQGVIFLLVAHLIWGAMAYYLKQLDHISPAEIAVHRGLWSMLFAAAMLVLLNNSPEALAALRSPRTLAILAFCSALIVFNWAIYVWAIQVGRTAEAALG